MTEEAARILSLHDFWAFTAIRFGSLGAMLMFLNLFVLPKKRLAMLLIAVVLLVSAYSVSMSGHYGPHLVHIEGVVPQGNYQDTYDH